MSTLCDVCDKPITVRKELTRLHIAGVQERLTVHSACADILLRCKGDFHKLPDGKLKRAILLSIGSDVELKKTNIVATKKQRAHIIEGLRTSHEEGMKRITDLAIIIYNLPQPKSNEYYTLDCYSQIVLMRKSDVS